MNPTYMLATWATPTAFQTRRHTSSALSQHLLPAFGRYIWEIRLLSMLMSSWPAYHYVLCGAPYHGRVEITSPTFEGKTRIQCHRLVYEALDHELKNGVHALSLRTKAA